MNELYEIFLIIFTMLLGILIFNFIDRKLNISEKACSKSKNKKTTFEFFTPMGSMIGLFCSFIDFTSPFAIALVMIPVGCISAFINSLEAMSK